MASRVLVSGLPRSLPPLPSGPGPTCVPCVEGRQRATPHSSEFPPTKAPLQTLHIDVWGPARVRGQGHERYFLLVVDDYSRYTTVFPLRSKGDVTEVLIDWIRAARLQLKQSFDSDFPVLRLHSDRGREFSSGLLRAYCRWQFYHPTSRRVLSSQDVTFDESVPYYRLFPYRTPSLPPPPLFLVPGPPPVDPLPPQGPAPSGVSRVDAVEPVEVAGDSGAAEGAEPGGADSGGAERVGATPGGAEPEGTTTGGAEPGGAEYWGAEPGSATPGGAEPGGAEPGGAEPKGATPRGAELGVRSLRELGLLVLCVTVLWVLLLAGSHSLHRSCVSGLPDAGGEPLELEMLRVLEVLFLLRELEVLVLGVLELLDLRLLLELELLRVLARRLLLSVLEAVLLGVLLVLLEVLELELLLVLVLPLGVLVLSLLCLESPRGLGRTSFRSFSRFLVFFYWSSSSLRVSTACLVAVTVTAGLPTACSVSPYTGPTGGLAERREPASRPASPVRAARISGRGSRQRPPPIPGTHQMSLRPSTAPLRAPLPSPPESSLPALADPESNSLRAASPTVTRLRR
ncbi:unnamed protein product [Closterium sp. NIES-64]|nr:unnamed protein product [Closterium sp. NIES-64]